jgi:hypothetical protein
MVLDQWIGPSSLPIPFSEQIGDRVPKPWQQILAIQVSACPKDSAFGRRVADFDELLFRVNHPG